MAPFLPHPGVKHQIKYLLCVLKVIVLTFSTSAFGQTVFSFNNALVTGRTGPTQAQVNTAYTGTSLDSKVTVNTQGIQEWTVPVSGIYIIRAYGAQGARSGGLGADIKGSFSLTQGEIIKIAVGQTGSDGTTSGTTGGGGGGGSFVIRSPYNNQASILVIAGGGGGYTNAGSSTATMNAYATGSGGSTYQTGGGTSGNGGSSGVANGAAAGGGGFLTDGGSGAEGDVYPIGGKSFINGLIGGTEGHLGSYQGGDGGFGGGGGGWHNTLNRSGGGGGYSGGQGGTWSGQESGGGGGSYNAGTEPVNTAGVRSGNGLVTITYTSCSFTNASATGRTGPTQAQVNTAYTGTSLDSKVTINTQGIQEWTVPANGTYHIDVKGAGGGANYNTLRVRGGYGSRMTGDFNLTAGQVLKIVVGQRGLDGTQDDYATATLPQEVGGSGGGASYVILSNNSALIVAGGGGGATTRLSYAGAIGGDALTGTSGGSGVTASPGAGGADGTGGGGCANGGFQGGSGGGGLTGNGGNSEGATNYGTINYGGSSFTNGANGGLQGSTMAVGACRQGGFGGGGAGGYTGGGGGGYSGGGAGGDGGSGGGGSYNVGENQINTATVNSGNGLVVITYGAAATSSISITATLSAFTSCSGTASAAQNFTVSGSDLSTDITIIAPTGFEVSKISGTSDFAGSVTLPQTNGTVSSTTIYVRLTNAAAGTPSGDITLASTGATTQNVAVSGTVTAASVGGTVKW